MWWKETIICWAYLRGISFHVDDLQLLLALLHNLLVRFYSYYLFRPCKMTHFKWVPGIEKRFRVCWTNAGKVLAIPRSAILFVTSGTSTTQILQEIAEKNLANPRLNFASVVEKLIASYSTTRFHKKITINIWYGPYDIGYGFEIFGWAVIKE